MSITTKRFSDFDGGQTLQKAYNSNATLGVDGWVVGLVGRKVTRTATSGTVDQFDFLESGILQYSIVVTYVDSSHSDIASVERTA